MSQTNEETVREFTRIFKNEHNVDGIDHLFSPDFEHHFRQDLPPGLEGLKTIGRLMNGAFPDVRVTEEDLISDETRVVERSSAVGTHLGEIFGIAPTGKRVRWTEIHIYELASQKIRRHWVEWSDSELLEQIRQK